MEERDQTLIDRFIAGEASAAERKEVDQRMQADPVFRQQVQEYEVAQQALRLQQREALRTRFRQRDVVLDKQNPDLTKHGNRNYWWIGIIAIPVILFFIWLFVLKPGSHDLPAPIESADSTIIRKELPVHDSTAIQGEEENKKASPDRKEEDGPKVKADKGTGELFAEYFEPYRDPMMDPATRGESKPSPLDDFRKAYWEGKYRDLPGLFQKLDVTYQQHDNYRFQLANALMENGKVNEAIPILESVIQNDRSRFVAEAHYYLGLGYLKKEDTASAQKWLKAYIGLEKAKQKAKANELLKWLE